MKVSVSVGFGKRAKSVMNWFSEDICKSVSYTHLDVYKRQVYSLVPYVGFGWAFGWDYTNQPTYAGGHTRMNGMTLNAGIINNFKLSDRVTLSIEFAATAVRSEFNQVKSSGNYDILGTASAGLIFNLGKTAAFSEAELRNPQEIDALNLSLIHIFRTSQL